MSENDTLHERQTMPPSQWADVEFWLLALAATALLFGGVVVSQEPKYVGVLLIAFGAFLLYLWWKIQRAHSRTLDELRRSLTRTRAVVVDHRQEHRKDEYDRIYTVSVVIVQFDAVQPDATTMPVRLSIIVSKELYERLPPGAEVQVEYAAVDPRYAYLEGESKPS